MMTSTSPDAHAPESLPAARRDIFALGARRAIAFMLDLFALQLVAQVLLLRWFEADLARLGLWGIPLGAGVLVAYFGVADSRLCSGQTVGKWLLRIRVVRRDGKPPGLCRTIVRAAIASVIYVAYESAPDLRAIEPLYAIMTFTMVAGLIAVCYLVNTRTQQLPHDLATATYVVPASRQAVPITRTFWRGHWPIMGAMFTAMFTALVVAWVLIPRSDDNRQYVNLGALATTIGEQQDVAAASVRAKLILHRSMVAPDAPSMWSVTATARPTRRLPYYELFAYHIAAQILTRYPASCSAGSIAVNTSYGYNVVIDRQDESHSYEFTPREWLDRLAYYEPVGHACVAGAFSGCKGPCSGDGPLQTGPSTSATGSSKLARKEVTFAGMSGSAYIAGDTVEFRNSTVFINGKSYGPVQTPATVQYVVTPDSRTLLVNGKPRRPPG
jgi:uncharacterized RDD family membrane protein YckC